MADDIGPRGEYRQYVRQRVDASATIAERFPDLRSLMVELGFQSRGGESGGSKIRYCVNIQNAKSVFLFDCPNRECVGGDFDLSTQLADAIIQQKETVVGESCCRGWLTKTTVGTRRCEHKLAYRLFLTYEDSRPAKTG